MSSDHIDAGITSINERGIPIDFLCVPGKSDTTLVFLHGAITDKISLPYLNGLGVSKGVEANRIFISDPSLYLTDKLYLSWYLGNSKQNNQDNIKQVLQHIFRMVPTKRAIFFGGSGGGFASLYFASQFRDSVSIVYNPQTIIRNYISYSIHAFTEHCYGIDYREYDPLSKLPSDLVIDLTSLYTTPLKTTVCYLQNLNDPFHIERHLKPFADRINKNIDFYTLLESWQDGHTPPPKDKINAILKSVTSALNHGESLKPALLGQGFKEGYEPTSPAN
ncbi:hypothetical protein BK816_00460 [Boudabousia tangfeifanii]|uniref:Peptidase S9 prolyl oligopeptidase catalytic domain-containing protein n=1 Tax=Boudabousia tangfeifanii TaxID=1912795 RepID=A0A1D9MID3_9ACTO|nr:hypothetical protein [Boudabousia tangfeifanii]AOZ71950.1 hypothetical protein BK816_00460 [Boudabousia tangfeifanii]